MPDLSIGLLGDCFPREDYEDAFALCLDTLKAQDVLFGNLEGVFSDTRDLEDERKAAGMHHGRGGVGMEGEDGPDPASVLGGYLLAGFSVLNHANNPSMTKGWKALSRCMELLDGAGIAHVGAGKDLQAARTPAIVERNGTRIAFLGYTTVCGLPFAATDDQPGVARIDVHTEYVPHPRWQEVPGSPSIVKTTTKPEQRQWIADDVRKARVQADIVVVSWHWGVSPATGGKGDLTDYQIDLGHLCIDSGASAVVGHHPHQTQAIEAYNGGVIYYSLGNWTHGDARGARPEPTFMARLLVRDKKVWQFSYVPALISEKEQAMFLPPEKADLVLNRVRDMSRGFTNTAFRTDKDEVVIEGAILSC